MFPLFGHLVSPGFILRGNSQDERGLNNNRLLWLWKRQGNKMKYIRGPWLPVVANRDQLPFRYIEVGGSLRINRPLITPLLVGKPGLKDMPPRSTPRINGFGLSEAILHSYFFNLRFVTFLCIFLGVVGFWAQTPDLFYSYPSLFSHSNFSFLYKVFKDTFMYSLFSTHHMPSPCEYPDCNEPLNQVAKDWFKPVDQQPFDPLGLNTDKLSKNLHLKAIALSVGIILVGLLLSDSVTYYGSFRG